MRKVFVLLVCLCACAATSFAQQGTQSLGAHFNYGNDTNLGIGVAYRYNFTDNWRVEPAFDYYFENDGISFLDFGANVHYLFPTTESLHIYPLAGLYYMKPKDFDGKLTVNLGCGLDFKLDSNITLNVEAKYMIIDSSNQLALRAGVAFAF